MSHAHLTVLVEFLATCIACFKILGDASMHSCMQMNLSGIGLLLKQAIWHSLQAGLF